MVITGGVFQQASGQLYLIKKGQILTIWPFNTTYYSFVIPALSVGMFL